jgi:cytosine/adenosine deaminase-related metal-dependent hydrolase
MTRVLGARWVLPIERPPIQDGWIEVVDDRISRVGDGRPPASPEDLGHVALLPGLVNAHTHLELSWMAGRVAPAPSMNAWIETLLAVRRAGAPGGAAEELAAARQAAAVMRAAGTALVGDISNTLLSPPVLAAAGLGGVVFHELLGFNAPDPEAIVREAWDRIDAFDSVEPRSPATSEPRNLSFSVVAHAPYSVSPPLFREIGRRARRAPLSVHLGESAEEIEFLRTGGGPIRQMLERLGVWTDAWRAPATGPVEYLKSLGYLRPNTLVVHGVELDDAGLDGIREAGAVIVTCPRSNAWVGAGSPPAARFYAAGIPVAIGTDSLASCATLNVFDELAELHRIAPGVAPARLLASATRVGATALGLGAEFGTLAPGKRAAVIAVQVPRNVVDVEEYLVSGIAAGSIRRIDTDSGARGPARG